MKRLFIILFIGLAGCTTLTHQATIQIKKNKIEFYSKNSQFQAKLKKGDLEAEYNSQKPSLVEDVLKMMIIKKVDK